MGSDMCICRGLGPVHFYDSAFTLAENIFGRSRVLHFGEVMCNCPASYLASAFAPGIIAVICVVVAILATIAMVRWRKWIIPLACVWLTLLCYSFWREFAEKTAHIEAAGPASQVLRDYSRMFLTAVPFQLLFDLVLLFAVPASITLVVIRKPRQPDQRS